MTAAITSRCSTRRWKRSATRNSSSTSSQGCARKAASVGIGIACYVEGTGIGPYEGAKVQVQANGKVSVATGIGTQGQGHFTSLAQIAADQLGVDVTDVDIVTGDTDQFYWGAGTFASRGAVVAGNAVNEAARVVRQKALKLASDAFECSRGRSGACRRQGLHRRYPRKIHPSRRARAPRQSDARRGQAGRRARAGIRRNISGRRAGRPPTACTR